MEKGEWGKEQLPALGDSDFVSGYSLVICSLFAGGIFP